MGITALYVRANYSGVKAQNEKWGGSDYVGLASETNQCEVCVLQIALSTTSSIVQVTLDGGATWQSINSGVALTVGLFYQFGVFIAGGDLFNVRATNASGTTVVSAKLVSDVDG